MKLLSLALCLLPYEGEGDLCIQAREGLSLILKFWVLPSPFETGVLAVQRGSRSFSLCVGELVWAFGSWVNGEGWY